MDDYENDGRDYGENIDEGPTNVETEGFLFSKSDKKETATKQSSKQDLKKNYRKQQNRDNSPIGQGTDKCMCKTTKRTRQKTFKSDKGMKREKRPKSEKGKRRGRGRAAVPKVEKVGGRRGRKGKIRYVVNPFLIFYLEMYYKNPKKCVTDIAVEAGKAWCSMSSKQKEQYINKAKNRSVTVTKKSRKKSVCS